MSAQPEQRGGGRMIAVQLHLDGGQVIQLRLREDAPELITLFQILASRGNENVQPMEQFLQLPLESGKAACSFNSRQLVSVITEPPVIVRLDVPAAPPGGTADKLAAGASEQKNSGPEARPTTIIRTPRYVKVDNFLSPDEYQDMLSYALEHETEFESGTVEGKASPHRQNRVIMGFAETPQSRLLQNRLLTWFPYLARELELDLFPVRYVESQLTASNDGHYYRLHCDAGAEKTDFRVLTCVYYFFRQPRPFSGGGLRLYDDLECDGRRQPTDSYREFEPVSNRLLVFRSTAYHELMRIRCPSRLFSDSRFAVTNWILSSKSPDPEARFGWGQLRCGVVPAQFGA